MFVPNFLPQWIVDKEATKYTVRDKAGFLEFHHYPVGSRIAVLRNSSEEYVLGEGTYLLTLCWGNKLLLYDLLLLSHHCENLDVFKHFIEKVETQLEEKLKLSRLIEVVNISFIYSKRFMKKKLYEEG